MRYNPSPYTLIDDAVTRALDRRFDQALHEHGRAEIVHRDVAFDRVHALPDPDLGREVDDLFDLAQRAAQPVRIADVSPDEFDLGRQPSRPGCAAVDLVDEEVKNTDVVAMLQEAFRRHGIR